MWRPVIAVVVAVLGTWFVVDALRRLPRVWRGDRDAVPLWARCGPRPISAETYLANLLWLVPGTALIVLAIVSELLAEDPGDPDGTDTAPLLIAVLFAGVIAVMSVSMLLAGVLDYTGRPGFLVPPPLRGDNGWTGRASGIRDRARRRERRRRVAAGQPATDHPVVIHDVRPLPGEDSYERYFVAVCEDRYCDWVEPGDRGLSDEAEEAQVRALAAKHSTSVAKDFHRPLG